MNFDITYKNYAWYSYNTITKRYEILDQPLQTSVYNDCKSNNIEIKEDGSFEYK